MIEPRTRRAELDRIPRIELATVPTPLQRSDRLGSAIGLKNLYVKRDDNTGLALGGNKARKLEYLVADAEVKGADVLITMGGPQSNHCRMTAAAAAARGLEARLVFNGSPVEEVQGNMVLDRLLGGQWTFPRPDQPSSERMEEIAAELRAEGHTPYIIPSGGTNGTGILGYVRAAFELTDQFQSLGIVPRHVVCASGSCGTLAGLTLGFDLAGTPTNVVGVSISGMITDKVARTRDLMAQACAVLEIDLPDASPTVWYDYLGGGYGIPTPLSTQALEVAASSEGIILDPVYTAKALGGLMAEVKAGHVDAEGVVVFMHTGGTPALFADQGLYWGPGH